MHIITYSAYHKKAMHKNFQGYFIMRISKVFSNQIPKVNTTFCSENTKLYIYEKNVLFYI